MAVSYKKLWKLLIDKICETLDCTIDDIMEFVPEEK